MLNHNKTDDKYIEPKAFKSVLGSFTTGVTVITTRDIKGGLHGFTANSLTSVSLNPPLVLFCLHNSSSTLPALVETRGCAISILSEEQQHLSENFAFNKGDKFSNIAYYESKNLICPILIDAQSWLECIIENIHPAGDHNIFVCRVVDLKRDDNKNPLVYYSGKYQKLVK